MKRPRLFATVTMSAMLSKSAMSARLLALPPFATLLVFDCAVTGDAASADLVGDRRAFLTTHCGECHADGGSEGGFAGRQQI